MVSKGIWFLLLQLCIPFLTKFVKCSYKAKKPDIYCYFLWTCKKSPLKCKNQYLKSELLLSSKILEEQSLFPSQ